MMISKGNHALCCLPSVKKQKHDLHCCFRLVYIETIVRFGFCDVQNNQGHGTRLRTVDLSLYTYTPKVI